MCYMSDDVGVRELRQNLSKHLRRVAAGRTLRVLDRGNPVAVLAPLPEDATGLDRLIREGKAVPARGDLAGIKPLPRLRSGASLSGTLKELREERLP